MSIKGQYKKNQMKEYTCEVQIYDEKSKKQKSQIKQTDEPGYLYTKII